VDYHDHIVFIDNNIKNVDVNCIHISKFNKNGVVYFSEHSCGNDLFFNNPAKIIAITRALNPLERLVWFEYSGIVKFRNRVEVVCDGILNVTVSNGALVAVRSLKYVIQENKDK
jgi:hypothetical protein